MYSFSALEMYGAGDIGWTTFCVTGGGGLLATCGIFVCRGGSRTLGCGIRVASTGYTSAIDVIGELPVQIDR